MGYERQVAVRSLRKDQHAVRSDVKRAAEKEAVILAGYGDHVTAPMAFEIFTVTLPIAVETELPIPCSRKADDVTLLRFVQKVSDDHDVVPRAAFVPTVVGEKFAVVMQVIDSGELPAEATVKPSRLSRSRIRSRYSRTMPWNSSRWFQSTGTVSRK